MVSNYLYLYSKVHYKCLNVDWGLLIGVPRQKLRFFTILGTITPWNDPTYSMILCESRIYCYCSALSLCGGWSPLVVFKYRLGVTTTHKMKNTRFFEYFWKNYHQKSCKLPPEVPMDRWKCRKASKDNLVMIYIRKE